MSDLLNDASLVLIPSGIKASKVYAQIPEDGSGDMTFSRASTGTRINSQGLVEVVPYNLAEYSNTFSNGVWTTGGYGNLPTLTANSIANPVNGLTDAWTASFSSSGTQGRLMQLFTGLTVGLPYTYSMYVKAGTKTSVSIYSDAQLIGLSATFNLSNGTITSTTSGVTATITALSNGWYFLTITNNILSNGNGQYGIITNTGDDGTLYIYGAQLNQGAVAKPYYATTDRLNIPRLNYQNGGGGCPSLLLEAQRTNLFTYSEQIDNSDWYKNGLTITANAAISPDGYQNADLLDDGTASSTQHWFYQSPSFSNSTTYTISFYAKYVSRKYMAVNIYNGATSQYVVYDIQNGSIYGSTGDVTASITSVGNGWYRIIYTRTTASSGSPNFRIAMTDDSGSETYTGSNKQTYLWGLQLEAGSYPSSYIPTLGTSVTRVADACDKTGISSLIGQTEGTLFVDFVKSQDGYNYYNLSDGTNNNRIFVGQDADAPNRLRAYVRQGGTTASVDINVGPVANGRYKMAIGYKLNDVVFYINGTLSGTDTNTLMPTGLSDLSLTNITGGSASVTTNTNQVILFPTRLTNAQLADLTTL